MSEAEQLQQRLEELASQYSLLSEKIANLKETRTHEIDEANRCDLDQQIEETENSRKAVEEEFYKKGRQFVYLGYPNALEALMDKMTTHDTPSPRFSLLYGDIAYIKGEWDKALDCYKQVFSFPTADDKIQIEGRIEYGKMLLRKGETQTALSHFEKSYGICKHISYQRGEAYSLYGIGLVHKTFGELLSAEKSFNEALEKYQDIDAQDGMAYILSHIGHLLKIKSDLNGALGKYNESLKISETIEDNSRIALFLEYIGYILRKKGDLEQALEKYEASLKIREEIGDKLGIIHSLNKIGYLFYLKGRDELRKFSGKYHKIHPYFYKKRDVIHEFNTLVQDNSLKKVLGKHQKSLEISREIGYKLGIAATLAYIADVLPWTKDHKKGDTLEVHEEALKKLNESLEIRKEIGDMPGFAASLNRMDEYSWLMARKRDELIKQYSKCLEILKEIGNKIEIAKCCSRLGGLNQWENPLLSIQHIFTSYVIRNQVGIKNQETREQIFDIREDLGFKRFKTIVKEAFEQLPEDLKPYLNIEEFTEDTTVRHDTPKVGRNVPCPCGSGKKYKKCCGKH